MRRATADHHAENDQADAGRRHVRVNQRRENGDRHARHAHDVAATRGFGVGQAAQCQNEQNGGDEVGEGGDAG
jgi:hypothetical protein